MIKKFNSLVPGSPEHIESVKEFVRRFPEVLDGFVKMRMRLSEKQRRIRWLAKTECDKLTRPYEMVNQREFRNVRRKRKKVVRRDTSDL